MRNILLVTALSAVSSVGCNLQKFTVNTTAPVLLAASKNFNRESDIQLAREAAPAQLKTADGFLVSSPENRIILEVLAQGYLEYAFGFLEDELEATPDDGKHGEARELLTRRATEIYDRSMNYALSLLKQDDENFPAAFQ